MIGKRKIYPPVIPDTPDKCEDGYMGALMTVREDGESLLYAGTNENQIFKTDVEIDDGAAQGGHDA